MTSVLYTGASGRMASALRESLAGEFEEVRLFARSVPERLFEGEEVALGDLADAEAVERACFGIDVIVHLGGIADESSFDEILSANIVGTQNVFAAARAQRVRRVVFASTNHVIGFYPSTQTIGPDDPPRPDTYYGVSKVFGEALGRLYHDKWGIEVVNLRIGSFRPAPEDERQLSIWLSPGDATHLVRRAVLAEEVGYLTVYGVSANTRSFWDNGAAAAALGYEPQDDAEAYADRIPAGTASPLQGGGFTDPEYIGGAWVPRKGQGHADR